MPVKDWMSRKVIVVDAEASIMQASKLMKQHGFHHLPVMKAGRLAGIVSDRDLKETQSSRATALDIHELYYLLDTIAVRTVMPPQLITITPQETLEKAAAVMLKHGISALPVVDGQGNLEGIITKGDIFRAFVAISGINQAELAMGFALEDRPGSIMEVTDVIRAHGGRLASILTGYEHAPEGFRFVFIRAKDVQNEAALEEELRRRFKVLYFMHDKLD